MSSNIRRGTIPHPMTGMDAEHVGEIYTLQGFFGEWAHLYRRHNLAHPIGWSDPSLVYNGLDSGALRASDADDPRGEPLRLLEGDGVAVALSQRAQPMPFAEKDVDVHQIRFYHRGRFLLETELGPLTMEPGDFAVIPRGLIYRETPLTDDGNAVFVFETEAPVRLAEELWDSVGYAGLFIDYSEMELPEPEGGECEVETEVRVRSAGAVHSLRYAFDPCRDVVGWLGDSVLFKLSIHSVPSPGTSRGHLPPSAGAVLWGEDRSFFFNAASPQPFPNTPPPRGSSGAPSHLNDYDEVWLTHTTKRTNAGHFWLLPRTIPHPGGKRPPAYPENPVSELGEMRINFDTKAALRWTDEVVEKLYDDPMTAFYTSFVGVREDQVPAEIRSRRR